jgi:NAD+ kinase
MMPPPPSPFLSLSPPISQQNSSGEGQSPPAIPSFDVPNGTSNPSSTASAFGDSILSRYASHIDPFQSSGESHAVPQENETGLKPLSPSPTVIEKGQTELAPLRLPSSPAFSTSNSFLRHRRKARSDVVPQQTIMKALASKAPGSGRPGAPVSAGLIGLSSNQGENDGESTAPRSSSQFLSAALSKLPLASQSGVSPSVGRLTLQSPCFFHQRFDGIINFDKVLEEIAEEGEFSHSRLMQTATGVREVSKQLQRRPIKRAVRNVMVVTKARDHRLVQLTRDLTEWLLTTPRYGSDVGVNVYVDAKLRDAKRFDAAGLVQKDERFQHMLKYWTPDLCWTSPEKVDLVLTLGGDGTVLFTSWLFQRVVPPILSFSLGSLGFLTNFEFDKYKEQLDRVMGESGMRVNLRMRFTCTVWRVDRSRGAERGSVEEGEQFEVLNELVIDRGPSPYVSNLELYGDDELLTIVQADGCIFSTPTGSTAYSLSAGGSLIHPSIPAILLTPICPHTLSFRPMVLSDALALRIAVPEKSRSTAYCSFDGKGRIELKQGDFVTLEASQYPFPTVMTSGNEWVESVQRALRWNVRGAVQKGWEQSDDAHEEEKWDIDIDSNAGGETDSGIGQSEDGGPGTGSPARRHNALLTI